MLAGEGWAVMDPDADSHWSNWRVGLWERPRLLYGVASLSRRNFSKRKSEKKRHSVAVWGVLLKQPPWPPVPLTLPSHVALPWWHRGPCTHTQSQWRVSTQTFNCGTGGCPSSPCSRGQVLTSEAQGWTVPDPASQRHLAPKPCAQGEAAEEAHTCILSGSHGSTPALQGQLAL